MDHALAEARDTAEATREAARRDAAALIANLGMEIAREREKLIGTIATRTATQLKAIEDDACAQVARFDAVEGEELRSIAGALVKRLVELALGAAP